VRPEKKKSHYGSICGVTVGGNLVRKMAVTDRENEGIVGAVNVENNRKAAGAFHREVTFG